MKNKASKGYEENYFFIFREGDGVYYNELETRYSAHSYLRLARPYVTELRPWGVQGPPWRSSVPKELSCALVSKSSRSWLMQVAWTWC